MIRRREVWREPGGRAPWWFLAPVLAFTAVFLALPVAFSVWLAFTRWNPLGTPRWVGMRQFEHLLTRDDQFVASLWNTFLFAFGTVGVGVPLALGLAFLFSRARGQRLWRAAFFLPQLTSYVAIAYIWQYVLEDRYGLANRLLGLAGLRGFDWLSDPTMAMVSVILVAVWLQLGRDMLVFAAAIDGVPRDLYEAAELDGAGPWLQLTRITVPMIRPAVVFVTVTGFISGMGFFALILAMTKGGPRGATEVTGLYLYEMAFQDLRMGRASAGALILAAVIGALTLAQFWLLRARREAGA